MRPGPFRHCVGVLGWPLDHTLSPVIHNAAFRRLELDWAYYAWPVPPELLEAAVRGIHALGGAGANVTMPHKEAVARHLDELDANARATGAVNTIHNLGDRLIGHNTDIDGFRDLLREDIGFDPRARSVLVLGSGGAARAVVKALTDDGAAVMVAARRPEGREAMAAVAPIEAIDWDDVARVAPTANLVVNATPLGMRADDPPPATGLRPGQTVVDLVYNPPVTPLVAEARSAGADAWGGLGMLVHQAAAAFRIWTGQEPPVEVMSAAAIHALTRDGGA